MVFACVAFLKFLEMREGMVPRVEEEILLVPAKNSIVTRNRFGMTSHSSHTATSFSSFL